jgi:hypothetical protein
MATVEQVALVRLLISDVDPARRVLSDDDILTFLNLEGDVVKLAAAQALDAIASSETLVGKVIRSQDLSTDGAKVAADLRAHAASLRAQAVAEGDDAGGFDVVGFGHRRPELTGH